jgi:hypothetical protein
MGAGSSKAQGGVPNSFWFGAGIGFMLSTIAVIAATEYNYRRGSRSARKGEAYAQSDSDLVDDLSSAVQEGLHVLAEAAKQISYTFGDARRELVRFGLDLTSDGVGVGGSGDAWYFDESDEPLEAGKRDEVAGADSREHASEQAAPETRPV